MKSIDGKEVDFSTYKGKKILIVNVASECGFTPQYSDLQKLHITKGDKVTILGFPSNDFGGQEPGTDAEIKSFCTKKYNVSFEMFAKVTTKGKDISALYQWLSTPELNGWNNESPTWNFCKYLINEHGELLAFYPSSVNPMSEELLSKLEVKK